MTAKELHDHVSQWPEGARARIRYRANKGGQPEHCAVWCTHDGRLDTLDAIDLHIASGLEWLTDKLNGIRVFPSNDAGPGWYIDDNVMPPRLVARGPTLFHAIRAAILATKENA